MQITLSLIISLVGLSLLKRRHLPYDSHSCAKTYLWLFVIFDIPPPPPLQIHATPLFSFPFAFSFLISHGYSLLSVCQNPSGPLHTISAIPLVQFIYSTLVHRYL